MLGVAGLMWRLLGDIDPRYRESAEESLVETAHLVATLIEQQSPHRLDAAVLPGIMASLAERRIEADIFGFVKTRIELRVVVVDRTGRVVYDSLGRHAGEDFSQWRDVRLALAGRYGARTSVDPQDGPTGAVMHVAAPIRLDGAIAGAVSAGKPMQSLGQFVAAARRKTLLVGAASVVAVLLLVVILSVWLVRPFGILGDYVRYVRAERSVSLPRLSRRAVQALGSAYDEMRDALAGRNYVAEHVQSLTHELKSPLSAIRGAAELLDEPMPADDHRRFVDNIRRETQRIQELVDRMMELAAVESRRRLHDPKPVALRALLEELAASAASAGAPRRITVRLVAPQDATVEGDSLLLRRAVGNLLDNALAFSPDGGEVRLTLLPAGRAVEVRVQDQGPGVPEFAQDRVFEKFFSLPRPGTQRRSTGLGLAFVKEVALLHRGRASLQTANDPPGESAPGPGALATLWLPCLPAAATGRAAGD